MDVTLECLDLDFAYPETRVLSGISFSVEKGRFYGLLGRNGSGKSTLLHCLNRICLPDRGRIRILGRDIRTLSRMAVAREISLVPQESQDIFPFRVLDVVVMGRTPFLGLTRRPTQEDFTLALAALDRLNAGHLAQKNFNRISGGERRITLLARALAQSTPIMLLDEPTNHLDFNNQYRLLSAIKELTRDRGLSVVAAMHDPNLAALFCDEVILLKEGRITAAGKVGDVMNAENIAALYDTPVTPLCLDTGTALFFPEGVLPSGPREDK